MSHDAIGNMLTILRNGNNVGFKDVVVPYSVINEQILTVLNQEGFIKSFEKVQGEGKKYQEIKVTLRYGKNGKKIIRELIRVSKPGRRIYLDKQSLPRIKSGFGTVIVTTSKGIFSAKEARRQKVGGEVICQVS